ncbi:MAG: NAD(P)H-hydrate dehydratase [Ruminococcus sp.]|nr:NAD(P)H-hydrate dehydratase [Ruminococcus sp.]
MQIVSPKQMREIELRSEELGVSRAQLMENAGAALAEIIDERFRSESVRVPGDKSIVFLAGSGNNGGDCFVAARYLSEIGYGVTVVNIGSIPQTDLARDAFRRLAGTRVQALRAYRGQSVKRSIEAAELDFMTGSQEKNPEEEAVPTALDKIRMEEKQRIERVMEALEKADVIVDGVFGTGFHGRLDGEISEFLAAGSRAYRIAVDVPSGGNCATGEVSEGTFCADETIALGALKNGMTQYPLKGHCGRISIADIGIPDAAYRIADDEKKYTLTDSSELKGFPKKRDPDSHKNDFGRVLCICGSAGMRGAAALSVMGALRSGAGLVNLASCTECVNTVSVLAPEAMFTQLDCDDYGYSLYECSRQLIESEMKKADAILIGCGLGVTEDTKELTKFVVENANCPIIIDADGINCIASDIDILLKKKTDIILTPHPGEMARLAGITAAEVNRDRFSAAAFFAEKYGVTVVMKGAGTVVADSGRTSVNSTGNPGMSKGGSGDVLAGITASLAAQGYSMYDSARFAAYIHGLAGDIAAEKHGEEFMLPRDIIDALSDSYRLIKEKNESAV